MSNPFNQQTNQSFNLQNAYQALMRSNNPMQAFSQIAMNSPQMQPIMNALNIGMNPQTLFYNLCQQRGINPQQFLNTIINRR